MWPIPTGMFKQLSEPAVAEVEHSPLIDLLPAVYPEPKFADLHKSHKSNETCCLRLLDDCAVVLRKFSLRHDPMRDAPSNVTLADIRHHEFLDPGCSIQDEAGVRFSVRAFRVLSTSLDHSTPKYCEYQIMKPVKGRFQIRRSGFRIKQLIWVQYLVHDTQTLTAVLGCNKVKCRRPSEKTLLETAHK
jgi:hypothetical protein